MTCRVPGFCRQAFSARRHDPVSQRDRDDAHLINAALDARHDDPASGYRFIAGELPARGITAGENRVARLCSRQQIWSAFARRRGLARKTGPPARDDLVRRTFRAGQPDRTWLTGTTGHAAGEGKPCLCVIKDVYPNRIAGYPMDSRMTASLAVSALRSATAPRSPAGTAAVHPDRGSRFRPAAFTRTLSSNGLTGSTGRAGACGDNAALESFFSLPQQNVPDRQRWSARGQLRLAIITWTERPATAAAGNDAPAGSRPPNTRQSTRPHTPPDPPSPESTKAGAVPGARTSGSKIAMGRV